MNEIYQSMKQFFDLMHLAESLKKELRHSWLSDGRQESVAEHSWRLSLMAMGMGHMFPKDQYDVSKAIKMAGDAFGSEIKNLWYGHENQTSFEAKVIKSLDKLEAQIQHNEADISTWTEWGKDRVTSGKLEEVSDSNAITKLLCDHVVDNAKNKLQNEK